MRCPAFFVSPHLLACTNDTPTQPPRRLTETPIMEDARIFFRTAVRLPEGQNFEVSMPTGVHEWRTQVRR